MEGQQLPLNIQINTNYEEKGTVECLGMTFESDEARRAYFTEKLREKLQEPAFRQIEGFPIGEDEDILALSDPPYYTACPNPFIEDFINYWNLEKDKTVSSSNTDDYQQEPFATDVSEGKGGKVYKAHTYHTKVPHEAIARYILHYTKPGDIILDAFAGSGMTGIAAITCRNPEPSFRKSIEQSQSNVQWGLRRAILIDLSPFATFIEHNVTYPLTKENFLQEALNIIKAAEDNLGDIYGSPSASYIIWSQVLICPNCSYSFPFAEVSLSEQTSIKTQFLCPNCSSQISKDSCQPKRTTYMDSLCNSIVQQNEYVPLWVVQQEGSSKFQKLREADLKAITNAKMITPTNVPIVQMMFKPEPWGDMYRSGYHFGVSYVHHFWTQRNLIVLSKLWELASNSKHFNQMRFILTSFMVKTGSRMHNIGMKNGKTNLAGQIFNTLQITSLYAERNLFKLAKNKTEDISSIFAIYKERGDCLVSTASTTALNLPANSIDYIFIDPPFGGNIKYSEMSFLYESWLRVYTNPIAEAIISRSQNKDVNRYRDEMSKAFSMLYRVLKPNRWITVEFHNSETQAWQSLQEALSNAGFIVADVRILDKQQGTFKQMTTTGSVNKDLVISAYKPNSNLEERFDLIAGTEEGCWEFIRNHLPQLPKFIPKDGKAETIAERQNYFLFDRMVAFHIQRNVTVPLSASEFYAGLVQRFIERDEMFFLPEEIAEYDKKRMTVKEILQLELVVSNEETAVQWLKQQLTKRPQTFQEIHPQFMLLTAAWSKAEKLLELSELLEQNFLCYESKGAIPQQIVSWLKQSSIHRDKIYKIEENLPSDAIALETDDSILISAAKDKWYVPDPNQAIDLEKLREKSLLREFEEYRQSKQKKLKVFRLEAVRAGFKKAWQERNYQIIVDVAKKIPESVLQEDQKLIMLYDNAFNRLEE